MIRRRKILNTTELQAEIDSWTSDEKDIDNGHNADKTNIIITPPIQVDDISEDEDIDDNVQVLRDQNRLPTEIPGQFEVEYFYEDDNKYLPVVDETVKIKQEEMEIDNQPSTSNSLPNTVVNWSQPKVYSFPKQPLNTEKEDQQALYEKIGSYSPLQLWECFFDAEVLQMIVDSTNEYAAQNKVAGFSTTIEEMRTFLGILYITGYHTLPTTDSYWSNQPSVGCQFIKNAMSRERFRRIQENIYVCDNLNLNKDNKFAKVFPLNEALNKRFMQFNVFVHNLSIDEQMIAYHWRDDSKMLIRRKEIKFGYKYWVLASADGYCFFFIPYAGASVNNDQHYEVGENVVLQLLGVIADPSRHNVTFDNFFTSYKLFCTLTELGYFATGTARERRTNHAPLMDVKSMKKTTRGSSDFCFDINNNIIAVRWNDKSVVTMMSNFLGIKPMCRAKRFDRKQQKMTVIDQPHLIHQYNQRTGGVDLFDNAMNNYRIRVSGKKWYWPLITYAFDAAMVNAWKLHCICRKTAGQPTMDQCDFRVDVVESLVTIPEKRGLSVLKGKRKSIPNAEEMAKRMDRTDHLIEKLGRRARCAQCGIKTEYGCVKCLITLHPKKCFAEFHVGTPKDYAKVKKAK